jgi:hypothetical protein
MQDLLLNQIWEAISKTDRIKKESLTIKDDQGYATISYDLYPDVKRVIKIENQTRLIVVSTETTTTKATSVTLNNCIAYVSRINEYLQIGCFEIVPHTYEFKYRMGQMFHSETNPQLIISFFLEQQNYWFSKIIEPLIGIITQNRNPIEQAQMFIKPLEATKSAI